MSTEREIKGVYDDERDGIKKMDEKEEDKGEDDDDEDSGGSHASSRLKSNLVLPGRLIRSRKKVSTIEPLSIRSSSASSGDLPDDNLSVFLNTNRRQTVNITHLLNMGATFHVDDSNFTKADGPSIFAHLPDVVVNMDHERLMPNQTSTQGVVMFLDISGFTALCETYSNAGKTESGIDQLTKTLNSYIGALVAEILSYDGDILKFAGDAILTVWYATSFDTMQAAIAHTIECALEVQKKLGEFITSVNVKLRIKIGISAGEVNLLVLGNNEIRSYVELGRAIIAVNKVEDFWDPGMVVVSPTAWCHCYNLHSRHKFLADGKHVQVFAIISKSVKDYQMSHTLSVQLSPENTNIVDTDLEIPDWIKNDKSLMPSLTHSMEEMENLERLDDDETTESSSDEVPKIRRLRIAIISQFNEQTINSLKLYVAPPVLKKMEDNQPLKYLSEMRQVTIVFINLIMERVTSRQQAYILQTCFELIYLNCRKLQGCVSKISLFDKGCTYLVLFGLPGLKHENDCAHALSFSDTVRQGLLKMEKMETVSIGVTTGATYCGVVGHFHRHEYTVIGPKVNKAARLMMYYPDKVTCDNETFFHSKLNKGNFIIQEEKAMKGLTNVGIIREYSPKENVRETIEFLIAEEEERCIVGRDNELLLFESEIAAFMDDSNPGHRELIVISGEAGVGRTRLLESVVVMGLKRQLKVCSTRLTLQDADTTLKAIGNILTVVCKLDYDSTTVIREKKIIKYIKNEELIEYLYILNQLLNVQFPVIANHSESSMKLSEVIYEIINEYIGAKGHVIFTIDDAHLLDKETWRFLPLFSHERKTMLIITMRSPIVTKHSVARVIINDKDTLRVQLLGLKNQHMSALACQFLNVSMIPLRLDTMLRQKSMGVPLWVELLLKEYLSLNVVQIALDPGGFHKESMVAPAPKYLIDPKPKKQHVAEEEILFVPEYHRDSSDEQLASQLNITAICVIVPGQEIDIGIPGSVKGMIQARIDRLEELDQLIIKTASVLINMQFFRRMLEHILPTAMDEDKIVESFQRLAEAGFIKCGTRELNMANPNYVAVLRTDVSNKDVPTCSCIDRDGKKEDKLMGLCRYVSFQSTSIRVTAYEMLMENIRRPLHKSAAAFIETQAKNCLQLNDQCNKDQMFLNFFYDEINDDTSDNSGASQPSARSIPTKGAAFQLTVVADADADTEKDKLLTVPSEAKPKKLKLSISIHEDTPSNHDQADREGVLLPRTKSMQRVTRVRGSDGRSSTDMHNLRRETAYYAPGRETKKRFPSAFLKRRTATFVQGDERRGSMALATVFGTNMKIVFLKKVIQNSPANEGLDANERSWHSLKAVSWLYPQMIDHFKGAGMTKNAVGYHLEAAAAYLALFDYKAAFVQIKSCKTIHRKLRNNTNPFPEFVSSIDTYYLSEIEESQMGCLIGRCLLRMGDGLNAMAHFRRSLLIIGFSFPRTQFRMKLMTRQAQFLENKRITQPEKYADTVTMNDMNSRRAIQRAECMQYIFEYSLVRKDHTLTRFSALIQLNSAEEAYDYPRALLAAYTCMIKLSELNQYKNYKTSYEMKAIEMVGPVLSQVRPDNMVLVTKLYWTIFERKLCTEDMETALVDGQVAQRCMQGNPLHVVTIAYFPIFIVVLFSLNMQAEAVDFLKTLYQPETDETTSMEFLSSCWYNYICIDLILSDGVCFEPISTCIAFADEAVKKRHVVHENKVAIFSIASALCVWYQRLGDHGKLAQWHKVATKYEPSHYDDLLSATAFLRQVECELLEYARLKSTNTDKKKWKLLQEYIKRDFRYFGSKMTQWRCLRPHFLHLQAYEAAISDNAYKSKNLLQQSYDLCDEIKNIREFHSVVQSNRSFGANKLAQRKRLTARMTVSPVLSDRHFWMEHALTGMPLWSHAAEISDAVSLTYRFQVALQVLSTDPLRISDGDALKSV